VQSHDPAPKMPISRRRSSTLQVPTPPTGHLLLSTDRSSSERRTRQSRAPRRTGHVDRAVFEAAQSPRPLGQTDTFCGSGMRATHPGGAPGWLGCLELACSDFAAFNTTGASQRRVESSHGRQCRWVAEHLCYVGPQARFVRTQPPHRPISTPRGSLYTYF